MAISAPDRCIASAQPQAIERSFATPIISAFWPLRIGACVGWEACCGISLASPSAECCDGAATTRIGHKACDGAGCEAGDDAVGAARQDDRYPGTEDDAGGRRAGKEGKALGQHIPSFEIWDYQHVGAPRHRRHNVLDRRCLLVDRV